ncbi:hybrid sensor histidine kinase/response regulator, partial [bacterium]|nr:hybrid sensor histidine kinase/response regulator [bacterium]
LDGLRFRNLFCIRHQEQQYGKGGHIPIIALTAHALTDDREKLLEQGFDGYVPKPIDVEGLLGEINSLLAKGALL